MKLFRDERGNVKSMINLYQTNPLDIFFLLARYKFAAKLLNLNDNILDAGCGMGIGSVMLSKFVKSIKGIDNDNNLIKYCSNTYKNINNLSFEVNDLKKLSGQYDGIVCMDVIEHFTKNNGKIVINNLFNALNDNGIIIIGTPNINSQKYSSEIRKLSHLYEYSYDILNKTILYNSKRFIIFSMTDEIVSTGFSPMAWYFIAVAIK